MTRKEYLLKTIRRIRVIRRDEDQGKLRLYLEGVTLEEYVAALNLIIDTVEAELDPDVLRASRWVDSYYRKALEDDSIRKPMSWALYKAWRRMDTKEVER